VQVPDRFANLRSRGLAPLGQEVPDEVPCIFVDPALPDRRVAGADHQQVLHQVGMECLAQLQKRGLFVGAGGQEGVTLAEGFEFAP
jgi:hypothetical protein